MIKIFVGSSNAAKVQARALIDGLKNPNIEFLPWWEQFTPGSTLLDELTRIKNEVNAAILIFTPEAVATNRKGTEIVVPNMNVLFEFGFFYSALGREKVSIIKYSNVTLPSDLSGYIHIAGSKFFKPGESVLTGKKTKKDFESWINNMISRI